MDNIKNCFFLDYLFNKGELMGDDYLGDKIALEDLENHSICAIFEEGIMKNRDYGIPVYLVYVNQIFPEKEYQTPKMESGIIEKGQMVRYKKCW